jgi:hypothetical protein
MPDFIFHNSKSSLMRSLIKKQRKQEGKVAQCCAKNSKVVAGCHD